MISLIIYPQFVSELFKGIGNLGYNGDDVILCSMLSASERHLQISCSYEYFNSANGFPEITEFSPTENSRPRNNN